MPYKSSLSEEEWKILEPLLPKLLPPKKQTRPSTWSKREILDGIFYQLKNGCNWQDLPKDLPPNCLWARAGNGAKLGQPLKLIFVLHGQVREQVKKKPNGRG